MSSRDDVVAVSLARVVLYRINRRAATRAAKRSPIVITMAEIAAGDNRASFVQTVLDVAVHGIEEKPAGHSEHMAHRRSDVSVNCANLRFCSQ